MNRDDLGQPESCKWGFEHQLIRTLNHIAVSLDRIANHQETPIVKLERGRH